MNRRLVKIKDVLERLYEKYNHRDCIKPDPLQFVYRYSEPADMEVAGLLSAVLAYGRVQQIEKDLNDLFSRMGASPYAFVLDFDKAHRKKLISFKHRFTTGQDISDLLSILKKVLQEKGSIEKLFLSRYSRDDENIIPALSRFCDSLYEIYSKEKGRKVSRGLKYLLASPAAHLGGASRSPRGSACKRLNLFLRWMVRDDEVDTGLWKGVDKAKLIVPVDVHIGRLCRILGFYPVRSNLGKSAQPPSMRISNGAHAQKTVSLSTAVQITKSFSKIEPSDPVKYDFALSRVGITEGCNGKYNLRCNACELVDFCHEGTKRIY